MPRLPKTKELLFLHSIIKALVSKYGRDSIFNLKDIHSGGEGGGGRMLIAALRDLPGNVVLEHLSDLQEKEWVKINSKSQPWTFQITDKFQDLPDMITPNDIIGNKMNYLSNQVLERYPECYELLKVNQQKLISASKPHDFSEIGNLCVQFWEVFTDKLWMEFMKGDKKPPKDQTKQKITPIVLKYVKSKTTSRIFDSLGDLFEAITDLTQKLKHGSTENISTIHDAKLAVVLTVILSEEIIYYLTKDQKW